MDLYCYISLAAFCTVVLLTVLVRLRFKKLTLSSGVTAAAAAAVAVLYFGVFTTEEGSLDLVFRNLVFSIIQTVRLFMLDADDCFLRIYDGLLPSTRVWYSVFAPCLYFLVPVLTVGFILSLFKNFASYRKLFLHPRKAVFAFSELNERSVLLAESIRQKKPGALICFARGLDTEEIHSSALHGRANAVGALLFKADITEINWKLGSSRRPICFFAISNDPERCTQEALALKNNYGKRADASLLIFSSQMDSQMLFSVNTDTRMHIRRIDPLRMVVDDNLYTHGQLLFRQAIDEGSGEKRISAVVLGLGHHGREMVKSLSWFGQMDGYSLDIHVFDRDPQAEERFRDACPELMSPAYNGRITEGDARYHIQIHTGIQVESPAFRECLRSIGPVSYVLAALGSDRANIEAAVRLRMLCLQNHCSPLIQSIVYSAEETELLKQATDYRGHPYEIMFIGNLKDIYDWDTLFNNELQSLALKRHLQWGDEASFWAYEFHYRASVASAIHARMRLLCGIPGTGKETPTPEERRGLELLEHRRWNAYMRSEGYCYSGSPDPASRSDLAKLHNDLVPFEKLSREEQAKDFVNIF